MIQITIPIDPIPQPRPRFANGRAYQPKKIVDFKEQVQLAALKSMAGEKPIEGEICARIIFYRKFAPTSRNFGDWDNLGKAICDALNGICYKDDSQIVLCTVEKRTDKDFPRIELELCRDSIE